MSTSLMELKANIMRLAKACLLCFIVCAIACSPESNKNSNQLTAGEQSTLVSSAAKNKLSSKDIQALLKLCDFPYPRSVGLIVVRRGSAFAELNTLKLLDNMKGNKYPFSMPDSIEPFAFNVHVKEPPGNKECWLLPIVISENSGTHHGFMVFENLQRKIWMPLPASNIVKGNSSISQDDWKKSIEKAIINDKVWSSFMSK